MSFSYRRLTGAAPLVIALAACSADNPVSPAVDRGQAQPLLAAVTNSTLPVGSAAASISRLSLDPSQPDAYGRASATNRGRYWLSSSPRWRWYNDIVRNASAAKLDPRFPLITSTTSAAGATGASTFDLYPPEIEGDNYWELDMINGYRGLKPSTQYSLAFVHYRLGVAGAVDQFERISTGTVTQPDTLKITSGTNVVINTDWTGAAPAGCAAYTANANPFTVAVFTSSATGTMGETDKCWTSNGILYGLADAGTQAKSMVGTSNNTTFSLPNYNYLVLFEGDAATGTPVWRVQIAQDLYADGSPVPNALAPFPAPATTTVTAPQEGPPTVDRQATFPVTSPAVLFPLPGSLGAPDSVSVRLTNVQRLDGPIYKAWYVNPDTKVAKPATGRYVRRAITVNAADTSKRDTTIFENVASTSTFKGGPAEILFTTSPYATIGNADLSDTLKFLLITVESSAAATTPSATQPFWVRVFKLPGKTVGGTVNFGEFNYNKTLPPAPVIFKAQGSFNGGVIGDTVITHRNDSTIVEFSGSRIQLNFSALTRPPQGYEYRGYLCQALCDPIANATGFLDIGVLVGPGNESLETVDDPSYSSGNVVGSRISRASLQYDFTTAGATSNVCDYDRFRLALQPKGAAPQVTTYVFDAPLSDRITKAAGCR